MQRSIGFTVCSLCVCSASSLLPELSSDLLGADNECSNAECTLSAIQLRAGASRTVQEPSVESSCKDVKQGSQCWKEINWARSDGVYNHPEWYPGLSPTSSIADFQRVVHQAKPSICPAPCLSVSPVSSPLRSITPAAGVSMPSQVGQNGTYITNRASKALGWTEPMFTIEEALLAPFGSGWTSPFGLSVSQLASWISTELLPSDPFGNGGVLVPWPDAGGDQLGDGGWVGYSRRQVCYITAKTITGCKTSGYDSGFARLLSGCPRTGDFGRGFVSLLASCAADPSLLHGQQGPLLLTAKAKAAPSVDSVRVASQSAKLSGAGLRVCDYDTGAPRLEGVEPVPSAGCVPSTSNTPGKDFMTGGLEGQATQDISAGWVGGYLFDAHACGLGGGQDERLTVYFPEVTVLAYFLSASSPFPQIRQPVWILGARNFFRGLDGTARFDSPMVLADVPLDTDLVPVDLAGSSYLISSSRPFLAFMSESQGFLPGGDNSALLSKARRNKEPLQRDVSHGQFSFEKQVRAWYRSLALTSYDEAVHPALKTLVSSLGVGPWLSGLWWGDSQVGMLALWIGQANAAPTWGKPLALDYYIYSDFTENPGNQCFVYSKSICEACLRRCEDPPPPRSAFYLPQAAYLDGRVCVHTPEDCGQKGYESVVATYSTSTAGKLWSTIETKLAGSKATRTVFDELLA